METDLAISRGIVDTSLCPSSHCNSSLSIYMTRSESNPLIPAIHHAQFATKRYRVCLAKDIIFSRAYTITSDSDSKVNIIRQNAGYLNGTVLPYRC